MHQRTLKNPNYQLRHETSLLFNVLQVWEGYVEGQEADVSPSDSAKPKQEVLQVIYRVLLGFLVGLL